MLLEKSVALITGGVQGFGREFAKHLLQKGARVVVADVNADQGSQFQEECSNQYGKSKLKFIKCDVTNSKDLQETFETTHKHFGGLDIVCNNAGVLTMDPKRSKQQVDVNLTGVIEGTYKAIDMMSRKNGGNGGIIINIASAAGFQLMPYAPVYTATKFGVVAFTRSFKHLPHFDEDNIRVNCICPSFCDTEMLRKGYEEFPFARQLFDGIGLIQISDVVKAFTICLEDEKLNASAIAVMPPNEIYQLSFPPPKPKL